MIIRIFGHGEIHYIDKSQFVPVGRIRILVVGIRFIFEGVPVQDIFLNTDILAVIPFAAALAAAHLVELLGNGEHVADSAHV